MAACLTLVVAVLAACGSSSGSSASSSTTTAKQSVCSAKTDLTSSVKALTNPSVLTGGKSGITQAVDTVKTDVDALGQALKAGLKPQVDAVKSALDGLQSAVEDLGNGSASSNLQAVGNAISKVGSTSADLASALQTRCPSG
jgi:ABC-type Fe3+-hydroxamate transport system substrate-binding protein